MSGICGIFHFDGNPSTKQQIERMMSSMAYWGPDGSGVWREGPVGLGHLMLHSTPESLHEKLPIKGQNSDIVITAQARIDNREELFQTLSIPHPGRKDMPDSQVILKAYEKWGEACPDYLLGDWAFAVWNPQHRRLFIARDHHGNTGLYYYHAPRFFAFSSSLKGLFALREVPRRPNAFRVAQILVSWPGDGKSTAYENIYRLAPAHKMTVTPDKIDVTRYWSLENTPELRLRSDQEYVDAFLEIYTEAVRCRLRSVHPVGIMLSGGLDSGSVAAIAAQQLKEKGRGLSAFTSVPLYETKGLVGKRSLGDESPYVEATSRYAGNIDIHHIRSEKTSPLDGIERFLFLHEEPQHAASNLFWIISLLEAAKAKGIGTLLTGQMGNATISWTGSENVLSTINWWQWAKIWENLRAWRSFHRKTWIQALKSQIIKPLIPIPLLTGFYKIRSGKEPWKNYSAINSNFARRLRLSRKMKERGHDPHFRSLADPRKERYRILQPGRSIAGATWHEVGAGFDIQVRDPTQDKRIMEFCLSIPDEQYTRDGKTRLLIRQSMEGLLPPKVLWNVLHGKQAADIWWRVQQLPEIIGAKLKMFERSNIAREYLDIPKMRSILNLSKNKIDKSITYQCDTVLLRGLMVGLFLLRFDDSSL
jgi:asparagine synthase (glutamine-hydrolysing)